VWRLSADNSTRGSTRVLSSTARCFFCANDEDWTPFARCSMRSETEARICRQSTGSIRKNRQATPGVSYRKGVVKLSEVTMRAESRLLVNQGSLVIAQTQNLIVFEGHSSQEKRLRIGCCLIYSAPLALHTQRWLVGHPQPEADWRSSRVNN
jgi:hypothetical protein